MICVCIEQFYNEQFNWRIRVGGEPMRSAKWLVIGAFGIAIWLGSASQFLAFGQSPRISPQELPAGNSGPGARQSPAAKPELNPAELSINDAYAKSKTASSLDDFSQIISQCQDGIEHGASAENTAYAKKLQAWSYNKRGEK
jgi:hypothetical protein